MKIERLVLASASPRRVELLQQLGLQFEQIVSPNPEPAPMGNPADHAMQSARTKAQAVADLLGNPTDTCVLGADTVVCIGDTLLGKPTCTADARRMLRLLGGRQHYVCTGVTVIDGQGVSHSATETTTVHMAPLSDDLITSYVESGEPLDKAGSYGIQGLGARFIERIEGCYYNVVGLPLYRLTTLLVAAEFNVDTQSSTDNA